LPEKIIKNNKPRTETILHIVLKFNSIELGFSEDKQAKILVGKWNKKRKKIKHSIDGDNRASASATDMQ